MVELEEVGEDIQGDTLVCALLDGEEEQVPAVGQQAQPLAGAAAGTGVRCGGSGPAVASPLHAGSTG